MGQSRRFVLAISMALVFGAFSPDLASAQKQGNEGPVGIFESGAEYDQFMSSAKEIAYGPNGNPELRAMIPILNDIALNQPIGSTADRYNDNGSILDTLANEKVREDLDMVDSQYEELKRLNDEIRDRMAEQIRSLDFSDADALAERIRRMQTQAQSDLNAVLLPHQVTRLRQIRTQAQLKRRSLVDLITSEPLKSTLEVSDEQSEKLRESEKQIQADLAKEIAKLREKARERLLGQLKPGQRAEVKEMLGDAFDFGEPTEKRKKSGKRK